jgi:hypothetical protein
MLGILDTQTKCLLLHVLVLNDSGAHARNRHHDDGRLTEEVGTLTSEGSNAAERLLLVWRITKDFWLRTRTRC